jgi:hypothetical protein
MAAPRRSARPVMGRSLDRASHLFLFIPWHPWFLLRTVKWQPNHRRAELPWATDGRRRAPRALCDSRGGDPGPPARSSTSRPQVHEAP